MTKCSEHELEARPVALGELEQLAPPPAQKRAVVEEAQGRIVPVVRRLEERSRSPAGGALSRRTVLAA
jgi:hypothetical protein